MEYKVNQRTVKKNYATEGKSTVGAVSGHYIYMAITP